MARRYARRPGSPANAASPVPASAPRHASSGSAAPSVKVAEVTTSPCAGCATKRDKRDAGIDPVAVDRDVGLQPVDPVEREPLDRIGSGRFAEIAQQPAPGGELKLGAPLEAADRRVETLPQAGLGRVVRVFEPAFAAHSDSCCMAADEPFERLRPAASAASTSPSIGGRASACKP